MKNRFGKAFVAGKSRTSAVTVLTSSYLLDTELDTEPPWINNTMALWMISKIEESTS